MSQTSGWMCLELMRDSRGQEEEESVRFLLSRKTSTRIECPDQISWKIKWCMANDDALSIL